MIACTHQHHGKGSGTTDQHRVRPRIKGENQQTLDQKTLDGGPTTIWPKGGMPHNMTM